MANTSAILFALMAVATASVAHGITLDGIIAADLIIAGDVKCTVAGTFVAEAVARVPVAVMCNIKGQTTALAQATSDTLGVVEMLVEGPDTMVVDISQCVATAAIPAGRCGVDAKVAQANLEIVGMMRQVPGNFSIAIAVHLRA